MNTNEHKPVLGVVGGIGSGKSLVAAALARAGGHLIAADELGHAALREPAIKEQVIRRWGRGILNAADEIDRRSLGRIVFADPAELAALEALVFPYIEGRIRAEIEQARTDPAARFIVLDAAIMLESGWAEVCDRMIFVETPRALRLERLRRDRGWSEEELTKREGHQLPIEAKRRRAAAIVENSAGPEAVERQVRDLLRRWGLAAGSDPVGTVQTPART